MRSSRLPVVTGLISLMFVLLATSAMAERRVALVIGNAAYQNASILSNTASDAKAMTALLLKSGFDVVESKSNLGVVDFKRAIRDFMYTARDADIAVVYFAGHGIEIRGSNYLVPVDAKLRSDYDADDEAVSLERIILAVEPVKMLRLIILDACRDNPFIRNMQRTLAARAVTGGLATIEPSIGNTLIAYAAKAGSISFDGSGPNSPFTTALMKHITEPGLDIRIALGRVRDEVMKMTANRQEPFVYGSLGGTTISLVGPPPAVPAAQAESRQDIQRDYEFAERIGTKNAWESFLQAHPTGYYAGLARAQLAKLEQTAEKALPSVIAARDPQSRDGTTSPPALPQPKAQAQAKPQTQPKPQAQAKEQQAKLEPKPEAKPEPRETGQPAIAPVAVDPCKRDQETLTRLRANPMRDDVIRLERELGCERLRPQVVRLRESLVGELPAAANVPPALPLTAGETRDPASPRSEPNKVAVETDVCKHEFGRLAQLRAEPVREDVLRFERELACERLRPQVLRLRESLGLN